MISKVLHAYNIYKNKMFYENNTNKVKWNKCIFKVIGHVKQA